MLQITRPLVNESAVVAAGFTQQDRLYTLLTLQVLWRREFTSYHMHLGHQAHVVQMYEDQEDLFSHTYTFPPEPALADFTMF